MELEKLLSVDEKELLSLVYYHRNKYQFTKTRQDELHPDDFEIIKLLKAVEKYVWDIAEERKKEQEEKPKESAKEQLKMIEESLDFIKKHPHSSDAQDEIKEDIAELKKRHKIFKKKCEEEEIAFQTLQLAKKNRDISTAALRDYLLGEKINSQWKNLPMGIS